MTASFMKTFCYFLFTVCLLMVSCQSPNTGKIADKMEVDSIEKSTKKDSSQTIHDSISEIEKTKTPYESLHVFTLLPGSDTLIQNLKMEAANQHLELPVIIEAGKTLFANISSEDKKANIRISQIGLPDGTFDGPFGRSIHYKLKIHGKYKIIIGQNMMAGDPWTGDLIVKVWVK